MFFKHRNLAIQSCLVVYSHACRTFWGEWSQSARPCHPLSFPLCFQQSKLARLECRHTHFEGHFHFRGIALDQSFLCKAGSLRGYRWVRDRSLPLHQFPCRQPERPAVAGARWRRLQQKSSKSPTRNGLIFRS